MMRSTEELVVSPDQARFIFRMAYLSFLSASYALYRGHYDLSLVPFSVGCSTMMYWIEPRYDWRRNVDMCIVALALLYQLYRTINAEYAGMYYGATVATIVCYPVGVYQHQQGNVWQGVYWHCLLHIMGNLANFILYKGNIE